MKRNKPNFGTMLGVIIGVASVIITVSIGQGIKTQINGQLHHLGKNLVVVRPASSGSMLIGGPTVTGVLSAKDVASVSTTEGVTASSPLSIVPGQAKGDKTDSKAIVMGVSPDLSSLLNQSVAYGQFITSDDNQADVAVLGANVADKMFDDDVPLGRTFTFRGQQFIVRGIFNNFNSAPLTDQANFNDAIFIPNSTAQTLTNSTASTYEILARASPDTKATVKNIRDQLSKNHGGDAGFVVSSEDSDALNNNGVIDLLTRLIAGVAAISLLVGGIGIMNVMLVSVAERTHEIGIRKSIGATNRQILNQFLMESTWLSSLGGVIGIIIALAVVLFLRLATNLSPLVDWRAVVIATLVSVAVGVIFGSVPALKAARKDPITALRQ